MADNIGGSTIHSFGRISFKDKCGVVIQSGRGSELSGSIFTDEEYHELRFLLLDEIEAAGANLLGRLEKNLRLNVPRTSSTRALQRKQHDDRSRQVRFAGVNVLFFGDFWQLDPTGDTSLMSNPTKGTGSPSADRMMSMFWHEACEGSDDHVQVWQDKSQGLRLPIHRNRHEFLIPAAKG